MDQPIHPALPRGYFAIGAERISKALNLGNLMRSAHGFGASFTFTIGAAYQALEARADTSKGAQHLPHYDWRSIDELALPQGLPAGRRGAARRGHRPAELPPPGARGLRAGPGARLAVARAARRAATGWCAFPPASASTSPWPARSSCTIGCVASADSRPGRSARADPRASRRQWRSARSAAGRSRAEPDLAPSLKPDDNHGLASIVLDREIGHRRRRQRLAGQLAHAALECDEAQSAAVARSGWRDRRHRRRRNPPPPQAPTDASRQRGWPCRRGWRSPSGPRHARSTRAAGRAHAASARRRCRGGRRRRSRRCRRG